MARVLVVGDDRAVRGGLEGYLRDLGHEVESTLDGATALEQLRRGGVDLCLLDLSQPGLDGMGVLRALGEIEGDRAVVIAVSARDDVGNTVEAMRLGAYDFLLKPCDVDRLRVTMVRALEHRAASRGSGRSAAAEKPPSSSSHQLVGRSEGIRAVFKAVAAVAPSRATVLVRGERGTGKELVARALHVASGRGEAPFVVVNCATIARELLEGELFGQARAALPGATVDKVGRLQLAGRGTLFLDEIAEISLELQAKLLRVLQERTFERVGDTRARRLEARVVAATHRDLGKMVAEGAFREDLYYRLKVVEIVLPPLRERRDDLPLLVEHLLGKIGRELHLGAPSVDAGAMRLLASYAWPGNVRELEEALTRACLLAKGEVVTAAHLELGAAAAEPESGRAPLQLMSLRDRERQYVAQVLEYTNWNKRRACAILQIARPTLDRKIREYDLEKPRGPAPPPSSPSRPERQHG